MVSLFLTLLPGLALYLLMMLAVLSSHLFSGLATFALLFLPIFSVFALRFSLVISTLTPVLCAVFVTFAFCLLLSFTRLSGRFTLRLFGVLRLGELERLSQR